MAQGVKMISASGSHRVEMALPWWVLSTTLPPAFTHKLKETPNPEHGIYCLLLIPIPQAEPTWPKFKVILSYKSKPDPWRIWGLRMWLLSFYHQTPFILQSEWRPNQSFYHSGLRDCSLHGFSALWSRGKLKRYPLSSNFSSNQYLCHRQEKNIYFWH